MLELGGVAIERVVREPQLAELPLLRVGVPPRRREVLAALQRVGTHDEPVDREVEVLQIQERRRGGHRWRA